MNNLDINIINEDDLYVLEEKKLHKCFEIVMDNHNITNAAVNIKIASNDIMQNINNQFRNSNNPTNIISFVYEKPIGLPDGILDSFLGDIVIAPTVLQIEATKQGKKLADHWCHIFIHGLLHLLQYDHQNDDQANIMENLEIKLLAKLQINNPYIVKEN